MVSQKRTPKSQIKASRNYENKDEETRKRTTINNYRRSAKLFIRKHATKEDLNQLQKLIDERITENDH